MNEDLKSQVRQFYDEVGWQEVQDGLFQNARYEDLRPVSQEYIHRCHLRVSRHLAREGKYLLDAGSGPIQYPEYLEYSRGYQFRVCADISHVALQAARQKIDAHGLFVVADIANLPFKKDVFDGIVSLHTIHHLPLREHAKAYEGLHRVLIPGKQAVIVNGWDRSPLMDFFRGLLRIRKKIWLLMRRLMGKGIPEQRKKTNEADVLDQPRGTYVEKHNPGWLKREVGAYHKIEIKVWRSLSVVFLRNFIQENWVGRILLRFVYWLEERFPLFFGKYGNYPLIILYKKENGS